MIIAASVDEKNPHAVIPGSFEAASGLLIIDTETNEILEFCERDWLNAMVKWDCEVLLCGQMFDQELFEEIAMRGITRYLASGLTAINAISKMLDYRLDIIDDYVGGKGCPGHEGNTVCNGDCLDCSANRE